MGRYTAGASVRSRAAPHAQHRTRWGAPPPHRRTAGLKPPRWEMARALASALLAGAWERVPLLGRGTNSLGRGGQWLRHLVQDVLIAFPTPPRDARDALGRFIFAHPAFREAWESRAIERTIRRRYVDAPAMREERWPVRKLETLADVGTWLGLEREHLEWFADRRGHQRTTGTRLVGRSCANSSTRSTGPGEREWIRSCAAR